jgi:sulfopyruvate decarboxylase subunit beta
MIARKDCFQVLLEHAPDEIVVAVYSAAFELTKARPGHPLNYTSVGAMGLASSHGLGLALGRPDRKVIVIDGDGSLLMNLGSLVTIGGAAPSNFYHFVNRNGTYEVNGAHPTPGGDRVDFAGLARAAGYRATYDFSELADFERQLPGVLQQQGPVFATLRMERPDPKAEAPPASAFAALYTAEARAAFKKALRTR